MYTLMIVEDEPLIREGLKHYFPWEDLGVTRILEAADGAEGERLALLEQPDLIITDIRMPEMDGLTMIERLRPQLPSAVFVILTGYNDFEYAQRAIRLGNIQAYLLKPLEYEDSLATVQACLAKITHRRQEELLLASAELLKQDRLQDSQESPAPAVGSAEADIFDQIEQFIRLHIDEEVTLQMVADRFFYNPSYLSRLFKTKLNKNYVVFVAEIRIRYAQECLKDPSLFITDVCTMCGYKSYKHFVKTFRSIAHMTPTDYRKQLGMVTS